MYDVSRINEAIEKELEDSYPEPYEHPEVAYENYVAELYRAQLDWEEQAACFLQTGELYSPEEKLQLKAAIKYCVNCPVNFECLQIALVSGEEIGVWGGATEKQRAKIVKDIKKNHDISVKSWDSDSASIYAKYARAYIEDIKLATSVQKNSKGKLKSDSNNQLSTG